MAVPEYRSGDTWPAITGTVLDGASAAVNISTAISIKFVGWLQPAGATVIGTSGTVTNLDDGTVGNRGKWSYLWGPTDLAVVGTYEVEIEVTWTTGKVESFPSSKSRASTYIVTGD